MKPIGLFALLLGSIIPSCHLHSSWQQIEESPFPINTNQAFRDGPRQLLYSPDGAFLAIANHGGFPTQNGSVSVFEVNQKTGALTEIANSPFPTLQHQTIGIAFSPPTTPSSLLAVSLTQFGIGTTIFDFDPLTGQLSDTRFPSTCTTPQATIAYSPDGLFAAAGGFSISLFSVGQSGSEAGNLTCIEVTPVTTLVERSIAYRPQEAGSNNDPYYLASLQPFPPLVEIFTIDRTTGLTTNSSSFSIFEPDDDPRWITFSPDGNFVAVAVQEGVIVQQFIQTGSGAPNLLPLDGSVSFFPTPTSGGGGRAGARSVAYSPNEKWLAVANGNDMISIFTVNRNTGVLFNRQDLTVGHIGDFGTGDLSVSVAFAPNSCFLAVSNRDDNSISVYKRKSHNCIACELHHTH